MGLKSINSMIDNKRDTIMGFDRYEVEEGVRTLQRAKRIQDDPALLKAVQFEAEKQAEALKGITKQAPRRERGGV
jgi:hypothetical protein